MPVQRCTVKGKSGWRWGTHGKCYVGKGAKAKASKQGAAIKAAGYQEHDEEINMRSGKPMFQRITTNFKIGSIRNDTMEERDYLVVPMVMMVEGVHEGSDGPLYYPADELAKTPAVWNYKPIIVNHPQANEGVGSACDPVILTNRKIGVIMNTVVGSVEVEVNEKKVKLVALKAEAWLEADRMEKVDERVAEAVEKNEMMELSTGLFTDNEYTEGDWNGEDYTAIARNYRPDHLALLPDIEGACSIEDGAGFLRLNKAKDGLVLDIEVLGDEARKCFLKNKESFVSLLNHSAVKVISNEISFDDTRRRLQSILKEKIQEEDYLYVEEVFDDYFVYERGAFLYKQNYDDVDGSISFKGIPVVVVKETNYVIKNERKLKMKKQKTVNALIKNELTPWVEDDREVLMDLEVSVLEKMAPVLNEEAETKAKEEAEATAAANAEAKAKEEAEASAKDDEDTDEEESVTNMTAEEYIDKKVPGELKGVFQSGLASYKANKSRLIGIITSNEKNIFTEEQLEAKDLDELKALVSLASYTDESKETSNVLNYAGQGDPTQNETEEEALELPVLNFGEKKKQ